MPFCVLQATTDSMHRREWTVGAAAALCNGLSSQSAKSQAGGKDLASSAFALAAFSADVTPCMGSPLCGGWIQSALAVDDPLLARGIVLLGAEQPIVLCAVDWCENRNGAYDAWRKGLAAAVGTIESRVAVQCLHQHNAPFCDLEADRLLQDAPSPFSTLDRPSFDRAIQQTSAAAKRALLDAKPITHVGTGSAVVEQVASSRRILGADGRIRFVRYSATKDEKVRAQPEGTIDRVLRTVTFWRDDEPVAALHYYATHPMSYYGDGRITSDFCGLARAEMQRAWPTTAQVYFTGCAGDVTAGKYNDGAAANRSVLSRRMLQAMQASFLSTRRSPLEKLTWRTAAAKFAARSEPEFLCERNRRVLADPKAAKVARAAAAIQLSWLSRIERPIDIACLDLETAKILHLPGEPFIDYQLRGQELDRDHFVCVAGYGDGGPGYIPTERAYAEGGYEPTVAYAHPSCERILKAAMADVLRG